jgi:hypothetical protein
MRSNWGLGGLQVLLRPFPEGLRRTKKRNPRKSVRQYQEMLRSLHDHECAYWPLQALLNTEASERASEKKESLASQSSS